MTSRDFCFWLQGHFEISKTKSLGEGETEMVKRHLALVFKHEIDPSIGGDAEELQGIHDEKPQPGTPYQPQPPIRC